MSQAFDYIIKNQGLNTDKIYEYSGVMVGYT